MFSGIMVLLLNWTDILMLGVMKSEKEVGIYNAAFKIGFIVLIIISTINVIIVPKISELFQEGKFIELKKLLNRSTQLITILTLPVVLVLVIFGKYILAQFGNEFILGYNVLIIITLSSFYSSICGNVDQILNFTNNQSVLMKINIFSLVLNIILNFFLIDNYGIEGAATASLISTIFLNTFCVIYIKRKLGFYTLF
jgi:O-antigen/teichoic acid export membrane protein